MSEIYDVAIIGAGTAGLSALREVRKQTDNFILVNAGLYGTTCARVGCMPSKIMIESANAFHHRWRLGALGIHGEERLSMNIPAVMRRVQTMREDFVADIVNLTQALGHRSIAGNARLLAPDELAVGERRLRARHIIIATGSRPILPTQWRQFSRPVWTSDDLFEQPDLPPRMAVIGLGAVGVEMAQALSRLGIAVTAFGTDQSIAGTLDPLVSQAALELLRAEVDVVLGPPATVHEDQGHLRVCSGSRELSTDAVFAALGRQPNLEGLGLENLGVALDARGMPSIDPHTMQVADLPVYFAGDVSNDLPVLHVANDEGHIAGQNATRPQPTRFRRRVPITIVFSDPNIAVVGARLNELDPATLAIGQIDFTNQGRARIAQENHGILRVYANLSDGLLLGAEMCAPRAEHLAQLLALAISQQATVHSLLRMPFYHPVFEEGLRTALRDAARQIQVKVESDLASCGPVGAIGLD